MIFSTRQHWTTLASYITSLIQHIVLCALQIKYDFIDKCTKKKAKRTVIKNCNKVKKLFGCTEIPLEPSEEELDITNIEKTTDYTPIANQPPSETQSPMPQTTNLDDNVSNNDNAVINDEDTAITL